MKAVQYDRFGGVDVLEVREADRPSPGPGEVLVRVRAAGINPGEAKIRSGSLAEMFPSTFPSGQGSDLAGVVETSGEGWTAGEEVLGWVDTRSSQAEYAAVPAGQLVSKPPTVDWPVAGGLFVAGATAWAMVRAVDPRPDETVAVVAAAGGVGGLAAQLALERGATVLGLAGPANHDWLSAHGIVPVDYAGGPDAIGKRLRDAAPDGIAAFVDPAGGGYVDLALGLGVSAARIDTVVDFGAAAQHPGVQTAGNAEGSSAQVLRELADRLADGRLDLPIAAMFALDDVRAAYTELERGHTRGKIVLLM